MARCLIKEAKLPIYLWNYALRSAAYIRNRCINGRTGKTPYENFACYKPYLKNMHTFGSTCFAYDHEHKSKLDSRCNKGMLIGYDISTPTFFVYFFLKIVKLNVSDVIIFLVDKSFRILIIWKLYRFC